MRRRSFLGALLAALGLGSLVRPRVIGDLGRCDDGTHASRIVHIDRVNRVVTFENTFVCAQPEGVRYLQPAEVERLERAGLIYDPEERSR